MNFDPITGERLQGQGRADVMARHQGQRLHPKMEQMLTESGYPMGRGMQGMPMPQAQCMPMPQTAIRWSEQEENGYANEPRQPTGRTTRTHESRPTQGMPMQPRSDRGGFGSMRGSNPSRPAVTPLYKTRLCNYHVRGACMKGASCHFAHGIEDLRASPDFERTSVCPTMLRIGRCDKPRCRYAHSADELRSAPGLLKTKLCRFYLNGQCVVGSACRFAHTVDELEQAVEVQRSTARPQAAFRQTGAPTSSGPRTAGAGPASNAMPARPSDDLWEMRRSAFLDGPPPRSNESSPDFGPQPFPMPFTGGNQKPMVFLATPSDSEGEEDGFPPKGVPAYNVDQPPFPQRSTKSKAQLVPQPPEATQQQPTEGAAPESEAAGTNEPEEPGPAQVVGGRVVVQLDDDDDAPVVDARAILQVGDESD